MFNPGFFWTDFGSQQKSGHPGGWLGSNLNFYQSARENNRKKKACQGKINGKNKRRMLRHFAKMH
jgi:hypothetical protein